MNELDARRKMLAVLGAAPFAGGLVALAPFVKQSLGLVTTPIHQPQLTPRERVRRRYFPDVTLLTQDNRRVRFYSDLIQGKVVTINMFYAKCAGVCPRITANLARVQRMLGDRVGRDIFMYSITLKPEEDTPAVIKEFAEMYHVRPGWTFLTGKPPDIERLRVSLGFTYPDPAVDKDTEQHIGNIRYGNEPYILWSACPGMAHAEWIVETLQWVMQPRA